MDMVQHPFPQSAAPGLNGTSRNQDFSCLSILLSKQEVQQLLANLIGIPAVDARLLYGNGLSLSKALSCIFRLVFHKPRLVQNLHSACAKGDIFAEHLQGVKFAEHLQLENFG